MTTVCTRKIAFQRGNKNFRGSYIQKLVKVVNVHLIFSNKTNCHIKKLAGKKYTQKIFPPSPTLKKNCPFSRNEVM
jgi:hypothetical protein